MCREEAGTAFHAKRQSDRTRSGHQSTSQQVPIEPFLLIGLIAVVRRVVVITAKVEQIPSGQELHNFLLELGVLAGLALAFGAAIYLLRRSGAMPEPARPKRFNQPRSEAKSARVAPPFW